MPAAIPITLDSPSSTGLGKFKLAVVLLRSLFSNRQQATGGSPYTRSSRRKKLRACGGACGGRVYRARGRRDRGEAHARTHARLSHSFPARAASARWCPPASGSGGADRRPTGQPVTATGREERHAPGHAHREGSLHCQPEASPSAVGKKNSYFHQAFSCQISTLPLPRARAQQKRSNWSPIAAAVRERQ